jgi:hypothetical protein
MLRIQPKPVSNNFKSVLFRSYTNTKRPTTRLKFFTTPECMLCYEANVVLQGALDKISPEMKAHIEDVEYVNIAEPENVDWFECYRYDIPVLHVEREGYKKVVYMHKFDHDELVEELGQEL